MTMSTAARRLSLGQYGERLAEHTLVGRGMTLLERNWRCAFGEIDLVLRDGDTLVVCEVKTRSSTAYGHPFEAVTEEKADRLRQLAARWVEAHGVRPKGVRIDLVGVVLQARGPGLVEHVRGIG